MKTVAIIGTAGTPARYGGFETLAHQLVNNLNSEFKLHVYCSNSYYKKSERKKYWNKARLHHIPLNANGAQSILYDIISIIHALFYADTLLVLGVSGGIIIPFVKWFTNKKIVVNIDGLEWRRGKWNKPIKKFLQFSEKMAVKYSDADITDNASIKRYTAIKYKTLSHLIEYGADHTSKVAKQVSDYKEFPFLAAPYAFKVARIEPENNIDMVLKAFSKTRTKHLVIVGNWDNSEYGINLKSKYSTYSNIHILDPIYNQQKLDLLRSNCYIYIHGHSAGGTNPSLVEAMYLELPILCFDVSYNRATTEDEALFFRDEKDLKFLLNNTGINKYKEIATTLKEIANRRYTWKEIANKYKRLVYTFDYNYSKADVKSVLSMLESKMLQQNGLAHMKRTKMFFE